MNAKHTKDRSASGHYLRAMDEALATMDAETPKQPDDVTEAIEQAKRTQGWKNRRGGVRRFELANLYGHAPCVLYVVPARRWAYRHNERQADAWRAERGGHAA